MRTKQEMQTTHGFKMLAAAPKHPLEPKQKPPSNEMRPMRRIGREKRTKRAQEALQKFTRMLR
jgi:hypothetical protein